MAAIRSNEREDHRHGKSQVDSLLYWTYEQALSSSAAKTQENCGVTAYRYDRRQDRLVLGESNIVYWR